LHEAQLRDVRSLEARVRHLAAAAQGHLPRPLDLKAGRGMQSPPRSCPWLHPRSCPLSHPGVLDHTLCFTLCHSVEHPTLHCL